MYIWSNLEYFLCKTKIEINIGNKIDSFKVQMYVSTSQIKEKVRK